MVVYQYQYKPVVYYLGSLRMQVEYLWNVWYVCTLAQVPASKFDLYCCSRGKMRQQLHLDHDEINGLNISKKIVNKSFQLHMYI